LAEILGTLALTGKAQGWNCQGKEKRKPDVARPTGKGKAKILLFSFKNREKKKSCTACPLKRGGRGGVFLAR